MLHACIVCGVLVGSGDAERDCMNGYGRDATKRVFQQRGQGLFDAINFNHTDNQFFYIHKMFLLS